MIRLWMYVFYNLFTSICITLNPLIMVESCELCTLKPKLWTSQIWTLIHLIYNFVCAKSSKLITLEENIISVQQLPLCFPLFFVFSSEALNSSIKAVLTELFFKMQFVKHVLVYVFSVFTFSVFVTVFMRVLSLKLF